MANMKITGTFKNYTDLLNAYGTIEEQADSEFLSFIKKIADQDCYLTNYNALNQTFDTAFWIEDPNQPGQYRITFPNGIEKRYMDNVGVDKLVPASIVCTNCDEHIYCKSCGMSVPKELRYDYEPVFSYGDIYAGNCTTTTTNNISGTKIIFKACEHDDAGNPTGRMFCPECRHYSYFDEVSNSF